MIIKNVKIKAIFTPPNFHVSNQCRMLRECKYQASLGWDKELGQRTTSHLVDIGRS